MNNETPSGNLKIRKDILDPIAARVAGDSQFRKLLIKIYIIASEKSKTELPDIPISKIIHNFLPSDLKNLDLTHDEVVQIVLLAEILDAHETERQARVFYEFLFGDPAKSKYWVDKGKLILGENLLNNAIRCFDKAIDIDANELDALYHKGLCLFKLATIGSEVVNAIWNDLCHFRDTIREAMQCFERIIEINPTHAKAWYEKGACLLEIGRPTKDFTKVREAMDCFRRSLSIDPDNQDVTKALKICEESLR